MVAERIPPIFGPSPLNPLPPVRSGRKKKKRILFFLKWGTIFLIWGSLAFAVGVLWYSYDLPDIAEMQLMNRRPSVTMRDANGTLLATYGDMYGQAIRAKDLPSHVTNALLAIEDRRFYQHFGVDLLGLIRAAWVNYRAGSVVQGGSTVTQQLAKNFLQAKKIYGPNDRSLRRKIQEAIMACWLEYRFNKEEILTMYLNRVYFGGGTFGIDGAALRYYGRPAKNLTLYEAAVLAGLLKAPSRYSPAHNPKLADKRARQVLNSMAEAGFISTDAITAALALATPAPEVLGGSSVRYFTDWIYDTLPQWVGEIDQDLEVTTTLDLTLQNMAAAQTVDVMAKQRWKAEQMSLVSMTPDGAIKTMIGGVHYGSSKYNRVTQATRQPGSAFKFFVFLAALEAGITPDTLIDDTPVRVGKWKPSNYRYRSQGYISVRKAFAQSVNAVTIRLGMQVGLKKILDLARRLGITTPIPSDLTITLGSGEVTLLELTGAFATIANQGIQTIPHGILEVHNREGKLVYRWKPTGMRVLSSLSVNYMDDLLKAVVTEGTGRSAAISKPSGGKTGTSQAYRDLWFVGYSQSLVTGVWSGIDSAKPMFKVSGGSPSTHLWKNFMEQAVGNAPHRIEPSSSPHPEDEPEPPTDNIGNLLNEILQ